VTIIARGTSGTSASCIVERMQTISHDPSDGIYPASPDYVHALEVREPSRWLFVSGTMGLDAAGAAPATLEGQLACVWDNLRTILAAAGMGVEHVVRVTSYLNDAADAEVNAAARTAALCGRAVPTTAIVVGTLAPDWLVELEVIAAG
jgi:2-iminobutanoate/2-iminopropanoate deaminase